MNLILSGKRQNEARADYTYFWMLLLDSTHTRSLNDNETELSENHTSSLTISLTDVRSPTDVCEATTSFNFW